MSVLNPFTNNQQSSKEKLLDKQFGQKVHQTQLQTKNTGSEIDNRREYVETLVKSGMREEQAEAVLHFLGGFVAQDFTLSWMDNAEIHEVKMLSRITAMKVKRMFPAPDDILIGDLREFMLDDPDENIKPITPQEDAAIDQFMFHFFTRLYRSRNGEQQESFNRVINVSQVQDDSKEEPNRRWFT